MGSSKLNPETGLTPSMEKFCQLYVSADTFGHGTDCYSQAFDIALNNQSYSTCKVNASKLLTNQKILNRINQLLEEGGLNEAFVDKQMLFIITQKSDLKAALGAIQEYNKLKSRITKNLNVKVSGESDIDYSKLSDKALQEIINASRGENKS